MYYKKYESERLYLSPLRVEDAPTYARWSNDESLAMNIDRVRFNTPVEEERTWIERVNKNGDFDFAVVRKEDDLLLGTYGVSRKNAISRRYVVGGFIGEKENRGKGYGTEALALITKYAFDVLNAKTIFAEVFEFNIASLKVAQKVGYKICGKYTDMIYYNNKYHNCVLLEYLRDDFYNKKTQGN